MTAQQDTIQQEGAAVSPVAFNVEKTTQDMLHVLDQRSKDIIVRRFGLLSHAPETLESIGKEYGITRERVRQIEANAKKALADQKNVYKAIQDLFTAIFVEHGGVLAEDHIVSLVSERLSQKVSMNDVHFYLHILPGFVYLSREKLFAPHWRYEQKVFPHVEDIVVVAQEVLKETNHPLPFEELLTLVDQRLTAQQKKAPSPVMKAALLASKNVAPTAFKEWGLIGWAETSPRGVGDKAYAVLRRNGQPSHFREITRLINEASFDHKKANPQTVHNELIKDGRFVLVGRGLYGLKEWGYMAGTVADVLEVVLKKAERPMTREELIDQVLKQRMVKKNTILLSLQNSNRFTKLKENTYTLKKVS